jgi:hypothetical protein
MTVNQPDVDKLKYSCNRAWRRQRPTNNMFEMWQNSAPFGGRPIGGAVEALLTKVVNWQYWQLPIVVVFVAAAATNQLHRWGAVDSNLSDLDLAYET